MLYLCANLQCDQPAVCVVYRSVARNLLYKGVLGTEIPSRIQRQSSGGDLGRKSWRQTVAYVDSTGTRENKHETNRFQITIAGLLVSEKNYV